jgi:hypothetical protein
MLYNINIESNQIKGMGVVKMKEADRELLLNDLDLKAGVIEKFYIEEDGAESLLEIYYEYEINGCYVEEAKMLLDDLKVFLAQKTKWGV